MTTLEMTCLEREQLRVLYTALYVGLGLIPTTDLTKYNHLYALSIRSLAHDIYDSASTSHASPKSKDGFNQRFPTSLGEVVQAFQSETKGIKQSVLLNKWRWTTRVVNSDSLLLRYIRDNGDTVKAAARVGAGLRHHCDKKGNAEQELSRGEAFYTKNKSYANFVKNGVAYLSGVSNSGAPIMFFCPRHHVPKDSSKQVKVSITLNIYEHAQLALPPGVQGCIMVWDMKGWRNKNRDNELIFTLVKYLRDCYPALASKIYLVNSPRVFQLFWKLIYSWMHAGLRDVVVFTRNLEDVYQDLSPHQLPRGCGGTSTYEPVWSDPRPEDELDDPATRSALEKQQADLRTQFENLTIEWLSGVSISSLQAKRNALLDQLEEVYWKLDPHVRPRYLWDRHGTLGLARKELAEGNVAQPKCKVERPVIADVNNSEVTIEDSESENLSVKPSLQARQLDKSVVIQV